MNSSYDVVEVFLLKQVSEINFDVNLLTFRYYCPPKIALQIADQVLERIEAFESRYLIHRDIKPVSEYIAFRFFKYHTLTLTHSLTHFMHYVVQFLYRI